MMSNCCRVRFRVAEAEPVRFRIGTPEETRFRVEEAVIRTGEYDEFPGPYEVTPKINRAQTLETRAKVMTEDLTVHQISVAVVSNPAGGQTVTIGII